MSYEDSVHYAVDTPAGIAVWNSTLPSGGVVVYLGEEMRPFTVAVFHEIRCLNILREELVMLYVALLDWGCRADMRCAAGEMNRRDSVLGDISQR